MISGNRIGTASASGQLSVWSKIFKRRWIGVARHLLRENAAMEHVVGCWRCSGGLWTSALPRTWTRYSESCVKCTRYASMSPPSVVICTPQNREASGTASLCSSTGRWAKTTASASASWMPWRHRCFQSSSWSSWMNVTRVSLYSPPAAWAQVQNVVRTQARTRVHTHTRTHAHTHPTQRCSYHGSLTRGLRGALSAGRNEARRRRGYGFRGQRSAYMSPFTTIRASPYWLRAMWRGLSCLHVMSRRKQ